MEVVGGDVAVELEVLGIAGALKAADNPGLLLGREQFVTPVIAVVGRLAAEVFLQVCPETLIVAGQDIIEQLVESPCHPLGFHLVEVLAGAVGLEGRRIDGRAPLLLCRHLLSGLPPQAGFPHRALRVEADLIACRHILKFKFSAGFHFVTTLFNFIDERFSSLTLILYSRLTATLNLVLVCSRSIKHKRAYALFSLNRNLLHILSVGRVDDIHA